MLPRGTGLAVLARKPESKAMPLPTILARYLEQRRLPYELVSHEPAASSRATAAAAHVPPERLAKGVLVESADEYRLVVIPASDRLELAAVRQRLGHQCGLAIESEVLRLFADCAPGDVPAVGQAYGIGVLVDDALLDGAPVLFDAGDDRHLVKMTGADFAALMAAEGRGRFGVRAPRRGAAQPPHLET
jgi:Ala-tRNA(Pro) deacylase